MLMLAKSNRNIGRLVVDVLCEAGILGFPGTMRIAHQAWNAGSELERAWKD
jgi:hypothetical protein